MYVFAEFKCPLRMYKTVCCLFSKTKDRPPYPKGLHLHMTSVLKTCLYRKFQLTSISCSIKFHFFFYTAESKSLADECEFFLFRATDW